MTQYEISKKAQEFSQILLNKKHIIYYIRKKDISFYSLSTYIRSVKI